MYSSEDLTRTVVLKQGNAFFVSTPEGRVPAGGEHPLGLHRDDCRYLSGTSCAWAARRRGCS